VGRVAFRGERGLHIVPVNFAVDGDSIVFRTAPYTELGQHGPGEQAAFEVDDLDADTRSGWSVVATGPLHVVSEPEELAALRLASDPEPWAEGVRRLYMRLRWEALTGRRLEVPGSDDESADQPDH
jgi:hypothetical protein